MNQSAVKPSTGSRAKPLPRQISESAEDYLERIAALIHEKGYARVSDVAESLGLSQPSVSVMIKRLAERGFLERERYRGFRLTPEGISISTGIRRRHETLSEFLAMLRVPDAVRERDVEGLEHHLSSESLNLIERLVRHWRKHPEVLGRFHHGLP